MRKIIFGLSTIISVILLIKIIGILINDFSRLTEYGLGYLIGLIVLFFVLVLISYLTGKKIIKKSP
jgi:type III secretory pathway component EscS